MKMYIIAAMFLSATAAQAASTGTLLISGTVAAVNDIVITSTSPTTLNITGGDTAKQVASVAETSNNATGFKISLSSANGGELRLAGAPTIKTTYQVKYDGAASYVTPTVAPAVVKNVTSLTGLTTQTSLVLVNVVAFPTAPAGVYSDTITLSIVANP